MDPFTIAQIVFAIAGAIKSMTDAQATAEWQQEASSKLNQIISQNAAILQQLKDLALQWQADLDIAFKNEITNKEMGFVGAFDQYMSGRHPDVHSISLLRQDSETIFYDIVRRGPCIYQTANVALALVVAIHRVLHIEATQTKHAISTGLQNMRAWASDAPGMFGGVANALSGKSAESKGLLTQEPQGQVSLYDQTMAYEIPGRPHPQPALKTFQLQDFLLRLGTIRIRVFVDITVDPNVPSFSISNPRELREPDDPAGPYLPQSNIDQLVSATSDRISSEVTLLKNINQSLSIITAHKQALLKMIDGWAAWE